MYYRYILCIWISILEVKANPEEKISDLKAKVSEAATNRRRDPRSKRFVPLPAGPGGRITLLKTSEKPWKTMENQWKTMEIHGKTMENHGKTMEKPWKTMEKPWKT